MGARAKGFAEIRRGTKPDSQAGMGHPSRGLSSDSHGPSPQGISRPSGPSRQGPVWGDVPGQLPRRHDTRDMAAGGPTGTQNRPLDGGVKDANPG